MNSQSATQPSKTIGFLGFKEFENSNAYRGAILVTDILGKPIEFRCTAPVRPSPLQRTLYGSSLIPHILAELIGLPLLSSINEKPEIILVADERYFELRHKISIPLIQATKACLKPTQSAGNDASIFTLKPVDNKFPQIDIHTNSRFQVDLESCGDLLRDLCGQWDLTEPFQRLAEGLQYVHDERVMES